MATAACGAYVSESLVVSSNSDAHDIAPLNGPPPSYMYICTAVCRAPNTRSHRIALVLYQTELKVDADGGSGEDDAEQPPDELTATQSDAGQL